MILVDHEKGGTIINPYIVISNPTGHHSLVINTSTFGLEAQEVLVSIHDWERIHKLYGDKSKLYLVEACVGQQRDVMNLNKFFSPFYERGVDAGGHAIRIPLGYLIEEVVKKAFPRSFETFSDLEKKAGAIA